MLFAILTQSIRTGRHKETVKIKIRTGTLIKITHFYTQPFALFHHSVFDCMCLTVMFHRQGL